MGFIYKITNTLNGKSYIGQTSRSVDVRWAEHVREAFKASHAYFSIIHYAIKEYGVDAFSVEVLEKCDDELLDEREQYWIKYYHTYGEGYNITRGGQGKIRSDNEEILKLWNEGLALVEISQKLNLSKQIVSKRLRYQGVSTFEICSRGNKLGTTRRRKVIRISMDGTETKVYNSVSEAAEDNGTSAGTICMACSGYNNRRTAVGYRWAYFDEENPQTVYEPAKRNEYPRIQVHQYSLSGEYIRSFDSMSDAAKSLGKRCITSIMNVCNKRSGIGYGYRWRYEKYDVLPEFIETTKTS